MQEWLFVFDSTHHAIAAEHQIKAAPIRGLIMQMIPTPRQITASCGLSLRITMTEETDDISELIRRLDDHGIEWTGLYMGESGNNTWYKAAVPTRNRTDEPKK